MGEEEWGEITAAIGGVAFALAAAAAMLRGKREDPKWRLYSRLLSSWSSAGEPGTGQAELQDSKRRKSP